MDGDDTDWSATESDIKGQWEHRSGYCSYSYVGDLRKNAYYFLVKEYNQSSGMSLPGHELSCCGEPGRGGVTGPLSRGPFTRERTSKGPPDRASRAHSDEQVPGSWAFSRPSTRSVSSLPGPTAWAFGEQTCTIWDGMSRARYV